jgi:hypothetical protein
MEVSIMRRILITAAVVLALGLMAVGLATGVRAAQGEDGPMQTLLARVADKLGVGEEELQSAFTEARQEMVDETITEAVADGRLSPERAEQLRERVEAGDIPRPGEVRHPRHRACRVAHLVLNSAATVLEMGKWELLDQIKSGKNLAQVAEEQGVENFDTALLGQVRADLDVLVEEDKLTQEQADAIFGQIEENIDRIINGHIGPRDRHCRPRHHPEGEAVPEGA